MRSFDLPSLTRLSGIPLVWHFLPSYCQIVVPVTKLYRGEYHNRTWTTTNKDLAIMAQVVNILKH